MATAVDTRITQGGVLGTTQTSPTLRITQASAQAAAVNSVNLRLTQAGVFAAVNFPTAATRLTQAAVQTAVKTTNQTRITQAAVMAVVRGRVYNPKLRAWGFVLDGHEFYVLKLADDKTLIYDLSAETWSWWSSDTYNYWRATVGFNWVSSGTIPGTYGSNVIVGDDTYGHLWVLDPELGYDEDPRYTDQSPIPALPFPRSASAQMIMRGRETNPCYQVYLTGSLGQPTVTGATVDLQYSDDQGATFVSAGPITVNMADFGQEFAWRSLGIIRAPGRIFRVVDSGAMARIEGLDVEDGSGQ